MTRWAFAAEYLDEISDRTLYHTTVVDDYLTDDRKLILLSSKGMGKTHLLRQKRKNIEASQRGALIIPSSTGADVDRETSFPQNIGANVWNGITQEDWALIWETAIILSVLSHMVAHTGPGLRDRLREVADDDDMPESVSQTIRARVEDARRDKANPVFFVNELLTLPVSKRKNLLKKVQNLLLQLYPQYVTSAVCVFIDSVDQALMDAEKNVDAWVRGQAGLAMAARNIFVNCSHIKVYTAIRQEAWNRFKHENKQVIEAVCCTLRYTKTDLKKMLDHLTEYYEGQSDFAHLLNTHTPGKVRNVALGTDACGWVEEDVFDYLHRHSLGSPRSLLHIVNGVRSYVDATLGPKDFEKQFRREVAVKAGAIARTKIDSEMMHFLPFLGNEQNLDSFFGMLRQNVFSLQNMREVSRALGTPEQQMHPFCELYNLGFLGALKRDVDRDLEQAFRAPMEFDWRFENCLPPSEYYLLHPALEAHLSEKFVLDVEPLAVVSPGALWDPAWSEAIAERTLKIFVSYAHENRTLRDNVCDEISGVFSAEGVRVEFWIDDEAVLASDPLPSAINDGITWSNMMLCLATPDYLNSRWCLTEMNTMWTAAINDAHKRVVPFVFDGADRDKLGPLVNAAKLPEAESNDRASLVDMAQSLLRLWRKRMNGRG